MAAAHVDYAGEGPERKAANIKVPDWLTVPLCERHHSEQHSMGWPAFEKKYVIDADKAAGMFATSSPYADELRRMRTSLFTQTMGGRP